jgi:hypothetical protein
VEAALAGAAVRIGVGGMIAVDSHGAVVAGTVGWPVGGGCTAAVKKEPLGSAVCGVRSGAAAAAAAEVLAAHIAVLRGDSQGSEG